MDYDALAQKYGASSAPQQDNFDSLASKYGGSAQAAPPPKAEKIPLFAPNAPAKKTSFIQDIASSVDERYKKAMDAPTILGGIAQGFGLASDVAGNAVGRAARYVLPDPEKVMVLGNTSVADVGRKMGDFYEQSVTTPLPDTSIHLDGSPQRAPTSLRDSWKDVEKQAPNIAAATDIAGSVGNLVATADLVKGAGSFVKGATTQIVEGTKAAKTGFELLKPTEAELIAKAAANDTNIITKNAEQYRKIIRPSKGDITKLEIKSGKSIDDVMSRIAEQAPPIYRTAEGGMDTKAASEQMRGAGTKIHEEIMKPLLETNPDAKFNLMEIGSEVKKGLSKQISNAAELAQREAQVDKYIGSEIARYGSVDVDAVIADRIKSGMWSQGFDLMQPTANSTARKIGNSLKRKIEEAFPNVPIKEINQIQGQYYDAANLLDSAHGRVVQGGRMGKYFAQATGGVVGTTVGGAAGAIATPLLGGAGIPVAATVGGAAGAKFAGSVTDFLNNPERLTAKLAKSASKITTPTEAETMLRGARKSIGDAQLNLATRQSAEQISKAKLAEELKNPNRQLPAPAMRMPQFTDSQLAEQRAASGVVKNAPSPKPGAQVQFREGQKALPAPAIQGSMPERSGISSVPAPKLLPQRNPMTGQMQRVYGSGVTNEMTKVPTGEIPKIPYPANNRLDKTPIFSYNKITNEAYKNIKENGGVTINLKGGKPSAGYAYSPYKDSETIIPVSQLSETDLDNFVEKYYTRLTQPGNHIGGWVDGDNAYLDISKVGTPTVKTIKEAEKAGQLAVFDLEKFETVNTKLYGKKTNLPSVNNGEVKGTNKTGSKSSSKKVPKSVKEKIIPTLPPRPVKQKGARTLAPAL